MNGVPFLHPVGHRGGAFPYKTMFKTRSPSPPTSPPTPHQDHELVVRRLIKIITGNSHTFLTEPIASTWAAFVQFPEFFHANPVDNYLLFIGVKREKFVELTKVPHR